MIPWENTHSDVKEIERHAPEAKLKGNDISHIYLLIVATSYNFYLFFHLDFFLLYKRSFQLLW